MSDTNGSAPGPAATAVPDDMEELQPSPLWRGLPIEKTSEAILVAILKENEKTNQLLETFVASLDGLADSVGPMMGLFGGGKKKS